MNRFVNTLLKSKLFNHNKVLFVNNRYITISKPVIKESNQLNSTNINLTIGQQFDLFLQKSKGEKSKINLNDLVGLLSICNESKHINYILHSIKVFQDKGKDFNENVASHFIRASLRANGGKEAAEMISIYKNRIGAWVTPKTLHLLIDNLVSLNEINLIIKMLSTISQKGVIAEYDTFEILIQLIDFKDENQFNEISLAANRMIRSEEDKNKFLEKLSELKASTNTLVQE